MPTMSPTQPTFFRNPWVGISLMVLYTIWSSTYLALRYVADSLPILFACGSRFLLAGVILFVFLKFRGVETPKPKQWFAAFPVGVLLFLVGNGFVAMAEKTIPSGLAALVVASMPLIMAIFGVAMGERPTLREWVGLTVGFSGVVLLSVGNLKSDPTGFAWLLLAPVGWAIGSLLSRKLPLAKGPMSAVTQMVSGGVAMIAAGVIRGEPVLDAAAYVDSRALLALAYLTIFGSVIAFTAYSYLLQNTRPTVATSYAYVNPVLAVLLGAVIEHETLRKESLISGALVVVGVAISMTASKTPTPQKVAEPQPVNENAA